jgi:hypothetical protein
VQYDRGSGRILVDVQTRDQIAVVDPRSHRVVRRVALPGCDHPHGLFVDAPRRVAFVARDGNARLLTLDLEQMRTIGDAGVGQTPDVLAFDRALRWLYVAAESGDVAVFAERGRRLEKLGQAMLADHAHTVAVDPRSHLVYFPLEWRRAFEAAVDERLQVRLTPGIDEVRMRREPAARRERDARATGRRIAVDERDLRQCIREPGRAAAADRVSDVAPVVRAVRCFPSQQLGKVTWSRSAFRLVSGQVGGVLVGATPPPTPQFQNVTRSRCGLVALASPAIMRKPGGNASTCRVVALR